MEQNKVREDHLRNRKNTRRYRKSEVREAIKGSLGLMKNVAKRLDCSIGTVRKYLDRNQDLQELMANEIASTKDKASDLIAQAIMDGDISTAKWYLDYCQKSGYKADYQKIQVTFVDDMEK